MTSVSRSSDWSNLSLQALSNTSFFGVAICDRGLRFRAVNKVLAAINGLPAEAHIGQKIHQVIGGSTAAIVQPAFEHVFSTGDYISDFEFSGHLPTRRDLGYWIEHLSPIYDRSGKVSRVLAVLLEVTPAKRLEQSLRSVSSKLESLADRCAHEGAGGPFGLIAESSSLIDDCISEANRIAGMMLRLPAAPAARRLEGADSSSPALEPKFSPTPTAACGSMLLSARERQVMQLLAEGRSNKEAADLLNISVRTVETYRSRVMLKLNLHSVADLVRYAVRHNLVAC